MCMMLKSLSDFSQQTVSSINTMFSKKKAPNCRQPKGFEVQLFDTRGQYKHGKPN